MIIVVVKVTESEKFSKKKVMSTGVGLETAKLCLHDGVRYFSILDDHLHLASGFWRSRRILLSVFGPVLISWMERKIAKDVLTSSVEEKWSNWVAVFE